MSDFPSTAGSFSWRELTEVPIMYSLVQTVGLGQTLRDRHLLHMLTWRKLMKRAKKDFLSGFLNIWYPIPSTNCFVRGKGEVTTDLPVKIMSYSMGIKQGNQ